MNQTYTRHLLLIPLLLLQGCATHPWWKEEARAPQSTDAPKAVRVEITQKETQQAIPGAGSETLPKTPQPPLPSHPGGPYEAATVMATENSAAQRTTSLTDYTHTLDQTLRQAKNKSQEGNFAEATRLYQAALAMAPSNSKAKAGLREVESSQRSTEQLEEARLLLNDNRLEEAEQHVRAALARFPEHPLARDLRRQIARRRAKIARRPIRLGAKMRQPISLDFREAPLRSVFQIIAKATGINFFFDRELSPGLRANISVRDMPVEETLHLILKSNHLQYKIINENSLLIYPENSSSSAKYQDQVIRSFYLANADTKRVAESLRTLLNAQHMVFDEKLNLILIRDRPEIIRLAEKIISLQDIEEPEVMLEVEILEVKYGLVKELGIRWTDQLTFAIQGSGERLTLADLLSLKSAQINVGARSTTIDFSNQPSNSDLLANPHIRVRNHEKAKIHIGDRVPVITTTSTSTGFISDTVSYVDVGLQLEVEPLIRAGRDIEIKINLEVSSLVSEVTSQSGTMAYQIGTRKASTVLSLEDGETQILAGLINKEERTTTNRIPGLHKLPFLGRLFSHNKDDEQRTEIILAITPRLIRTIDPPELDLAEFEFSTELPPGPAPTAAPPPPEQGPIPQEQAPPPSAEDLPEASLPPPQEISEPDSEAP